MQRSRRCSGHRTFYGSGGVLTHIDSFPNVDDSSSSYNDSSSSDDDDSSSSDDDSSSSDDDDDNFEWWNSSQLQQEKAVRKRRDAKAELCPGAPLKLCPGASAKIRKRKAHVAGIGLNNSAVNFSSCSVLRKRKAKKPRKGFKSSNSNNAKSDGSNDCGLAATVARVHWNEETLQEHNTARMKRLIAKSASAERDAAHYKQGYKELAGKYDALLEEQRIKSSSNKCSEAGSEVDKVHELSLQEQEGLIEWKNNEIAIMEERRRDYQDASIKEWKRLEAKLARAEEHHCKQLTILIVNQEELLARRSELEKAVADLTTRLADANAANESCQDTIATLQANVSNHLDTISDSRDNIAIAQLEANLQSSEDDLTLTKCKMAMMHKDQENASLKAALGSPLKQLEKLLKSQEEKIASLESAAKTSKPIIDTVDLSSEGFEPTNKHIQAESAAKGYLPKLVQVKEEKVAVETALKSMNDEKEVVEADLEEVKDDLEDANDLVQQQALATDIWQRRFDELVAMTEAGTAYRAAISDIRRRSLASGS